MRFGRSEVMKTSSQPTAQNQWFFSVESGELRREKTVVDSLHRKGQDRATVSRISIGTLSDSTLRTPVLRDGMERSKTFSFPGLMDTS